jgi:hypothetical protein
MASFLISYGNGTFIKGKNMAVIPDRMNVPKLNLS